MTKFLIISTQRSGSTWMTDLLNSHPNVRMYTELFLKKGRGFPDWGRYKDLVYWNTYRSGLKGWGSIRPFSIFKYLDEVFDSTADDTASGFKIMYAQLYRYPEIVLYMIIHKVKIIHLVRWNTLDSVLSRITMAIKKTAHNIDDSIQDIQIILEIKKTVNEISKLERQKRLASKILKILRLPYLQICYEDVVEDSCVVNSSLEFLNIDILELKSDYKKLNKLPYCERIINYDEFYVAMQSTPYLTYLK